MVALTSALLTVSVTSGSASDAAQPDYGPAIPAGQEDLAAAMLGQGRDLPGDCRLSDSSISYSVIDATYQCGSGVVVLELAYPSDSALVATRTQKFSVRIESGTPPDGLLRTVVALIRARESTFRWLYLGADGPPGPRDGTSGGEPIAGS